MDALTQTEMRALGYALDFGKALGGLTVLADFMKAAQEFPEIRDTIIKRAGEYADGLLAEFAGRHG